MELSVGERSWGLVQKEGEECGRKQTRLWIFPDQESQERETASRSWMLCIESNSGEKEIASSFHFLRRDEFGYFRA